MKKERQAGQIRVIRVNSLFKKVSVTSLRSAATKDPFSRQDAKDAKKTS